MTEAAEILNEIENFFSEEGILAKHYENYEYRVQQEEMAEKILETLENRLHVFIEAPTGIGKSFAYLVPAIYYAKKNQKKVIVSTYTINLQEQLINKDIPFLQKVLPVQFKAKLLKGRNNYLCPKRLMRAMESSNTLLKPMNSIISNCFINGRREQKDGTRSDIDFAINENVWNSVCSERGICTQKTCGGDDSRCFFKKQRRN
ncbi:MAG: DEAD/DEAH box helicase [Ignavibacteria bacterium]|nr:DEAD/DEAH box helicase [Ignavibacteria bacterium]